MTPEPKPLHRVTFKVEDGCIYLHKVECLSEPGAWCLVGCPVDRCDDWSHGEEGCTHCQGLCDCLCSTHNSHNDPREECSCAERDEHGDHCPHAFTSLGSCWLLPWMEADSDWFEWADDVRAAVRDILTRSSSSERPAETWTIDLTGIEGEGNDYWYAIDPDPGTLRQSPTCPTCGSPARGGEGEYANVCEQWPTCEAKPQP